MADSTHLEDLCKLWSEKARLNTYKSWKNQFVKGSDLAFAGFFHRDGYVQCVFCSYTIQDSEWKKNDYPLSKHQTEFPDCSFIKGLEAKKNVPILDFQNNIYISANEEIDHCHLLNFLKFHMRETNVQFKKNTRFSIVSGVHSNDQGEVIKDDKRLTKLFHDSMFKTLKKYCGNPSCTSKCNHPIIWDQYNFEVESYPTTTNYIEKSSLSKLANDLRVSKQPNVVIFASCYSNWNEITTYLRSNGVISSLNIIKDRGDISGDRLFMLDETQQKIIEKFSGEVRIVLYMILH